MANGHQSAAVNVLAHAGQAGAPAWGGKNRIETAPSRVLKPATPGQVKAIFGIARQAGVDLGELLSGHGVDHPRDLSIRSASALIDRLKADSGG